MQNGSPSIEHGCLTKRTSIRNSVIPSQQMDGKVDRSESREWGHSEDAEKTIISANGNMSLLNVNSRLPTPETMSGISEDSDENSLIVCVLETGFQYRILKENENCCVLELSKNKTRAIFTDVKNRRMDVLEDTQKKRIIPPIPRNTSQWRNCRHAVRHMHRTDHWSHCGCIQNLPVEETERRQCHRYFDLSPS